METFFGIILLILAIVFWKYLLMGLFGAFIFGLIGAIFGETGASIGALIGFLGGIGAANDKKKEKKAEAEVASKPEAEVRKSHTTGSSSRASSSNGNAQIIRCPECTKKVRVGLPLKRPTGKCPACSAKFDLSVDGSGKVQIDQAQRREKRYGDNREEPKARSGESTADYYAVLGVAPTATPDEVRTAYRKKIREYHPDRVAGLGEKLQEMANDESRSINKAYSMLKAAGLAS